MEKIDSIARKILGWKLNRWDRWFDYENGNFIPTCEFKPEENLDHAMIIVERLEKFGFNFQSKGESEAYFNGIGARGNTLPEAITNAAYSLVEYHSIHDSTRIWQRLC